MGGVEVAEEVGKAVKTGISRADVLIGATHVIEDLACNDVVCSTVDVVGIVSGAVV